MGGAPGDRGGFSADEDGAGAVGPVRLGEDVRDKTRWLGWQRPGRIGVGDVGGQSQMRQDFADDVEISNRRDQAQAPAALRASKNIDVLELAPAWPLALPKMRAGSLDE